MSRASSFKLEFTTQVIPVRPGPEIIAAITERIHSAALYHSIQGENSPGYQSCIQEGAIWLGALKKPDQEIVTSQIAKKFSEESLSATCLKAIEEQVLKNQKEKRAFGSSRAELPLNKEVGSKQKNLNGVPFEQEVFDLNHHIGDRAFNDQLLAAIKRNPRGIENGEIVIVGGKDTKNVLQHLIPAIDSANMAEGELKMKPQDPAVRDRYAGWIEVSSALFGALRPSDRDFIAQGLEAISVGRSAAWRKMKENVTHRTGGAEVVG